MTVGLLAPLRRAWGRHRLSRGQCGNCRQVLRDDATNAWCSDECAQEWQDRTAY